MRDSRNECWKASVEGRLVSNGMGNGEGYRVEVG